MRKYAILLPLGALLIAVVWFAIYSWGAIGGAPLPIEGKIAMVLGVIFSLLVGCGLMALLFYSSRYGYDDAVHFDPHERRPK